MSRILRRPMFRGGRVDSRGTGITTGRDRPGMQGGGMPPTTGGSLLQRATDFFTKPALGPDGQPIPVPRRNFAEDAMFFLGPGKFFKAGGGGLNILKQAGKFANKPDFIGTTSGVSQRTLDKAPFLSNQDLRELVRPYTSGMKETAKQMVQPIKDYSLPFGIGTLATGYGLSKMYEGFKDRQIGADGTETEELSAEQQQILDLQKQLEADEIDVYGFYEGIIAIKDSYESGLIQGISYVRKRCILFVVSMFLLGSKKHSKLFGLV